MQPQNEKALKMLETALGLEDQGGAYYHKAARECKNQFGREMFESLAKDESAHAERIKEIFAGLKGDRPWDRNWEKFKTSSDQLTTMFRDFVTTNKGNIKGDSSDIKALDVGIDMETKSISLYEAHLKVATDPIERAFTEQMVREEKKHHKLLSETRLYLTDPSAYYTEVEKSGFDGI